MALETRARGKIRTGNVARTCGQTAVSVIQQLFNQAVASPAMVLGEWRSNPECAGRPEGRHATSCKPQQGVFVMLVVDAPVRFES